MTGGRLSGDDLRAMFAAAAALLERNMQSVNALNVFPVPDGDTGTNMFLTLQAVVEAAGPPDGAPASEVASKMARAALMGARGNSGVILSQLFKGFQTGIGGGDDCGPEEFAASCASARDLAYKSVGEPVEGTMLTVMSSVADAAQGVSDSGGGLEETVISPEEAAAILGAASTGERPQPKPADAERLRLLVESTRIRLAYAYDRQFAVSLSGIRTLPHQIEAVYLKMLPQPRLRFLLDSDWDRLATF